MSKGQEALNSAQEYISSATGHAQSSNTLPHGVNRPVGNNADPCADSKDVGDSVTGNTRAQDSSVLPHGVNRPAGNTNNFATDTNSDPGSGADRTQSSNLPHGVNRPTGSDDTNQRL
ncbi:hypothetical protein BGZ49_008262 [Haplosporangium sp. Z 27]|nr:hypothetical protein BGZ49_008262 [Haplosporangium sp. Z 27]